MKPRAEPGDGALAQLEVAVHELVDQHAEYARVWTAAA